LFVSHLILFRLYIRRIAACRTPGRFIAVLDLTKRRVMLHDPSLVLLIVYCKYFKVLCLSRRVSGWRKNDAKLKLIFQTAKLFRGNFCSLFQGRRPEASFLKSECKGREFLRNFQIFTQLFSKKNLNPSCI